MAANNRTSYTVIHCPANEQLGCPLFRRGAVFNKDGLQRDVVEGVFPEGTRFETISGQKVGGKMVLVTACYIVQNRELVRL